MKIRVIVPAVAKEFEPVALAYYSAAARSDVQVSVTSLDEGPTFVGSLHEAVMSAPYTVAEIVQAERDGMHAVISDCMTDPGVEAGREMVSIPVIGPAETSIHVACILGHRFSIVTPLDTLISVFHRHVRRIGLTSHMASVRGINTPRSELGDEAEVLDALIDQAAKAAMEDGAHVIILGSTGMARLAKGVERGLTESGIGGVPVIDPAICALKMAEALADMGLSHSKRTYPSPPEKEIVGY